MKHQTLLARHAPIVRQMRTGLAAAACIAALSGHPLGAAAATDGATAAGNTVSSSDKKFLMKAAAGGVFEVQAGKLAADKATDPAIKAFGKMLATDHAAANDKLMTIAVSHGLTLPSTLPASEQKMYDKLNAKSGKDFDKAFVEDVGMKDHKKDISMFEKASKKADAEDIRSFASATLPTLKEHLADAEKLPH